MTSKVLVAGERVILYQPILAKTFGTCAALLLQQVHYWCSANPREKEGFEWCYNSHKAWGEQIGYSERQIQRSIDKLRRAKVLIVDCFNKHKYDRTRWYRIDYDLLMQLVAPFITPECPNGKGHNVLMEKDTMSAPIPESLYKDSTGEEMKAEEILEKQKKKGTQENLKVEWMKNVSMVLGGFQKPLTLKETGQLSKLKKIAGEKSVSVIRWTVENWMAFATEVKAVKGKEKVPVYPSVGFLLENCDVAINMLDSPGVQVIAPAKGPQSLSKAPMKVEDTYHPSSDDMANLLAKLGAQ